MYKNPTQIYRETGSTSSISTATPHKLILILFDACLEQLAIAKGGMERKDIKVKVNAIKQAIEIIVRLQACLDFERGGGIAERLDHLYTFCTNRLALANAINDIDIIDEVYLVVAEVKLGWVQIEDVANDL